MTETETIIASMPVAPFATASAALEAIQAWAVRSGVVVTVMKRRGDQASELLVTIPSGGEIAMSLMDFEGKTLIRVQQRLGDLR